MIQFIIEVFVNLFVIIDPIAVVPMFVLLTHHDTPLQKQKTALKACLIGAGILTVFGVVGDGFLTILGISGPAFQIAGGILLMLVAIDMVVAKHSGISSTTMDEEREAIRRSDVSVFPLAIPLIAGPGAMTSIILQMRSVEDDIIKQGAVIATMLTVLIVTYAFLRWASFVTRLLGVTGTNVITRVFGIIIAALAVQFIVDGIKTGFALS